MLQKILNFIISIFTYKEESIKEEAVEEEIEEVVDKIVIEESDTSNLKPVEEENNSETVIVLDKDKTQENNTQINSNEVYNMLTNKERQTYFKKLGLYTIKIDNVRGPKQKLAEKIFNTIFLNKKNDTYTEETDKLLRIIYKSYCASPYMVDSDWQYFKNFKKSEYKCKCKGKYCNGYPSGIAMKLVMEDQYLRNYFGVAVTLTSGVRCTTHNKNVGGVTNSRHKKGLASDKIVSGKSASEVSKVIKVLPINRYCYDITKSAVHGDVNL